MDNKNARFAWAGSIQHLIFWQMQNIGCEYPGGGHSAPNNQMYKMTITNGWLHQLGSMTITTICFSIQRLQGYHLMQSSRGYSESARKLSSKLKYPVSCLRHMLRSVQLNIYINIQNKSQNLSHNLQNTRGAKQWTINWASNI